MHFRIILAQVLAVAVLCGSMAYAAEETKDKAPAAATPPVVKQAEIAVQKPAQAFKTDEDKLSYIIGTQLGENFKQNGLEINAALLAQGVMDVLGGKDLAIPEELHQEIMMAFQKKMMEKREKEQQAEAEKKISKDNAWKLKLEKPALMTFDAAKEYHWVLTTNKGVITVRLMPEVAPMHVTSTIFLTKKGFYDGLAFHRVIPGFMAQGGCPLGDGSGGPGYKYDGEFKDTVKHDRPYLLSMANAGPGTDGSQFFLTFAETAWLDGKHTIFGEIVEGKDVMKKLEEAGSPSGATKEPLSIVKAAIVEKAK